MFAFRVAVFVLVVLSVSTVANLTGRKTMWLEVRTTSGKWQAQGHIIVK